ncbi:MAG: hypothetical protein OHK0019_05690 [Saprospiraceae bacterium]
MKPILYVFLSLTFSLQLAAQNRFYVNHAATGANDGSSWANAYTNLQLALQTAQAGDEIWVAEGVYFPTPTADRSISFEPASGVQLYGGFAGTETALTQRDWQAHPTVLSGDIGTPGDSTDNSYNVIYLFEPDSNTVLDGFVVRHGTANNPNVNSFSRLRSGGGLYIMGQDADAYPDIRNCVFTFNTARSFGGAVMVNGSGDGSVAPRFVNCRFEYNRAVGSGGGVARIGGSWTERGNDLEDCVFLRNRAGFRGGGFYYLDSERTDQLDIRGCTFQENVATDDGGGAYLVVGRSVPSGYSITRSVFRGNQADDGGAFVSLPQNLLFGSYLNVDSCEFADNQLVPNGSIQRAVVKMEMLGESNAQGQVKNCKFQGNNGWEFIVTMLLDNAEIIFDNIIISNNKVAQRLFSPSGAYSRTDIYNSIFAENDFSFAICYNGGDKVSYHNCVFEKNTSADGQYMDNPNIDTLLLQNCTFANNDIGQPHNGGASMVNIYFAYNCGFSGVANVREFFRSEVSSFLSYCYFDTLDCDFLSLANIICGPGLIIGSDPLFVNPDSGDYRLLPCSPLRDAGSNTSAAGILTDIVGSPRILGGTVDIGAYEAPAFAFTAAPQVKPACFGQANGSVSVTLTDGCEPLGYLWQPGGPAGPILSDLSPGAYQVTITDAQGRTVADTIFVPTANPPTLQVSGSPVSCFGAADALLSVSPLTGQPPFAYLWSLSGATDSLLSNLGPGPVSVTVTDAQGCTASFSFDIPEPDTLQFAATVQNASSPQSADGSIVVNNVTGGTPPYDFLWSPGGSTDDMISGLLPGFYTLTVTDERGCEAAWIFEVKAVLGTGEAEGQAILIIYPNPARESVTIKGNFENAMPSFVEIYDAGGRLIRSKRVSAVGDVWQISLEGLTAGSYAAYLKGKNGDLLGFGRLVKI